MGRSDSFLNFAVFCMCVTLLSSGQVRAQALDPVAPFERFGFKEDSVYKGRVQAGSFTQPSAPPSHWRGFALSLQSDVQERYADNVFATQDGARADFVTRVSPSAALVKQSGRHQLAIEASADWDHYARYQDEDTLSYRAAVRGRLEARKTLILPFAAGYERAYAQRDRQRGAVFETLSLEPIEERTAFVEGGFEYKPNRLALSVMGRAEHVRYEDGPARDGTAVIVRDGDYNSAGVTARVSYDMGANLTPFVEAGYARDNFLRRDYDEGAQDFTGISRDHTNKRARAGLAFSAKGLISGLVAVGRESLSYKESRQYDTNGTSLAAQVRVTPTPKWTAALSAVIAAGQDSLIKAALEKKRISAGVDYELRRDWFASLSGVYMRDDFTGLARTDDSYKLAAGLSHVLSPRSVVSAGYEYVGRDSTADGADLSMQAFMVRLGLKP